MTLTNIERNIQNQTIDCVVKATDSALRNDLREHTFKQVSVNAHYNSSGFRYPLFDFYKIANPIENIIFHSIRDYDFSKDY